MTPEQELALREFAEGIQRAITEGLEQVLCCPPASTWQDDEGWKEEVAKCGWGMCTKGKGCKHYDPIAEEEGGKYCAIYSGDAKKGSPPCYSNWHPPINPATDKPYLTLAAWQADQPKPMRDMTEFEKGYVLGYCHRKDDCVGCPYFNECPCGEKPCKMNDPDQPNWQAPQVPLNFTVEG